MVVVADGIVTGQLLDDVASCDRGNCCPNTTTIQHTLAEA